MATKSNLKSVKIKPVKLTINDRELNFVLDLNAFAEIEDNHGNLQDLMYRVESGSLKAVRAVIWAGLQSNENPPTEREVGSNIQLSELENYMKLIVEAMGLSMPEPSGEKDPN